MRILGRRFLLMSSFLTAVPAGVAHAQNYQALLDDSRWSVEASPMQCRLTHEVPRYGAAVFELNAGETMTFYLKPVTPMRKPGKATLQVVAPSWHADVRAREVGTANVVTGTTPVKVGEAIANRFISELQTGMFPSVQMTDPFTGQHTQVDVSSVNFNKSYPGYASCVAAIFPANFEQLKASKLTYRNDQWRVDDAMARRLDLLVAYMALDPAVTKISVDGHSDRVGRQGHNWEISRLRANAVKEYLIAKGIPANNIVMRYFGETRLAVKTVNNISSSANRRVLVQLIRN